MARRRPSLRIESSFPRADSTLRFLEPADSCRDALWQRLFAGTYDKPFILDSGPYRTLHFDLDAGDTGRHVPGESGHIEPPLHAQDDGVPALQSRAARILLLGLGGGSLAKFCYRGLPRAAVTAVEINRDVIELREGFCIPATMSGFVICAEGAHDVAHLKRPKDVILADACDRRAVAPELDNITFYQQVRRRLSTGGVSEQPMW